MLHGRCVVPIKQHQPSRGRDGWCCYTLGGWCLINADGKGYRVGVFAGILNIVTGKFKGKLCTA